MANRNTKNKRGRIKSAYAAKSRFAAHRTHKNVVPIKRATAFEIAWRYVPRYKSKSITDVITIGYIWAGGHRDVQALLRLLADIF